MASSQEVGASSADAPAGLAAAPLPLLPADEDIAAAVARLPPLARAAYTAYYSCMPDGGPQGAGYVPGGETAALAALASFSDVLLQHGATGNSSALVRAA